MSRQVGDYQVSLLTYARQVLTTRRSKGLGGDPDLVARDITALQPNQLATDVDYGATHPGVAYVCLILHDVRLMVVGWRMAGHTRTESMLGAIEMA